MPNRDPEPLPLASRTASSASRTSSYSKKPVKQGISLQHKGTMHRREFTDRSQPSSERRQCGRMLGKQRILRLQCVWPRTSELTAKVLFDIGFLLMQTLISLAAVLYRSDRLGRPETSVQGRFDVLVQTWRFRRRGRHPEGSGFTRACG